MNKRPWTIAAALLAAAIITLVIVVASLTRNPSEDTTATAAPEPPPAASLQSSPPDQTGELVPDAMGRRVLDVGQVPGKPLAQTESPGDFPAGTEPVGPPAGLELQRVARGVTIGVSTSDGPTGIEDGVLTGFARSPQGAGLLAMTHRARVIAAGPEYTAFLKYYFPDAFAQLSPTMINEIEAKDESKMRDYMSTGYLAPSWFKVRACDENFCTVETADVPLKEALGAVPEDAQGADRHSVTRVSMAWRGDHWVIVKTDAYNVEALDDSWVRWL